MLKKILFSFLILNALFGNAQFYSTGTDAARLSWKQLKSKHFQLIFPEGKDSTAQVFANYLEFYYQHTNKGLQFKKTQLPVIMHAHTVKSNGMVAWTPKRMEIYLNPPQDNYAQNWLQQLAVHEVRHVVQMNLLNGKPARIASFFMGELSIAALAAMSPLWLLEGDAVLHESIWQESGRGRLADFDRSLKAWLYEKEFNYDKLHAGSYLSETPNHYQYGYYTCLYGAKTYGMDFWKKQFEYIARKPHTIIPTYFSLKKYSQKSRAQFISEALQHYKTRWQMHDSIMQVMEYPSLLPEKNAFEQFRSIAFLNDSTLVAEKYSYSSIPELLSISIYKKEEKRLHQHGFLYKLKLSTSERKDIVWAETEMHPRWEHEQKSSIKMLSYNRRKVHRFPFERSLESPAISAKGTYLAAVENMEGSKSVLHVFDLNSQEEYATIVFPKGTFIQFPSWADEHRLVYTFVNDRGKGIELLDLRTKERRILIPEGRNQLSKALMRQDTLYFIADYHGTDNVYAQIDGEIVQLTNSKFGVGDFSLRKGLLAFTNYSSDGFYPALIRPDFSKPTAKTASNSTYSDLDSLARRINPHPLPMPDSIYTIKSYRKALNLFRFHSFFPAYVDLQEVQQGTYSIHPGFSLFSQNALSTSELMLAYEYDQAHVFHLDYAYKGWFPVINLGFDYGDLAPVIIDDAYPEVPEEKVNLNLYASAHVPLTFYRGKWLAKLQSSFRLNYNKLSYVPFRDSTYSSGWTRADVGILFVWQQRRSLQELYPRWGMATEIKGLFSIKNNSFANSAYVYQRFYLPGLVGNHSFRLSGGYFMQKSNKYLSYSLIPVVRGIKQVAYSPEEAVTVKLDYSFPLCYPEISISSLLYIKRIQLGVFSDYAYHWGKSFDEERQEMLPYTKEFASYGLELSADYRPFRTLFDFNTGVQVSYLPDVNKFFFAYVFSIDL